MKIAVIDSGINLENSILKFKNIESINFIEGLEKDGDNNGHGTSTMGEIDYIAPDVEIVSLKVLDEHCRCSLIKLAEALNYCIERDDIDIINMSCTCYIADKEVEQFMTELIDKLLKKGKIVVGSIANRYLGDKKDYGFPAIADGVIRVRYIYKDKCYEHIEYDKENDEIIYHKDCRLMPSIGNEYRFYGGNSSASAKLSGLMALCDGKLDIDLMNRIIIENNLKEDNQLLPTVDKDSFIKLYNDFIYPGDEEHIFENSYIFLKTITKKYNIDLEYRSFCSLEFSSIDKIIKRWIK